MALAVDVRGEGADQRLHRAFGEDGDVIHTVQRGQNLAALLLGHQRTPRSLQRACRDVAVHRHHQSIGFAARRLQVAHVPHVQEIEEAVGQGDAATRGALRSHGTPQRFALENLSHAHRLP